MAYHNLFDFLVLLSKHPTLRTIMKAQGPEASALMDEAGLTQHEKDLVNKRDEKAIRDYLGQECAAAAMINIVG